MPPSSTSVPSRKNLYGVLLVVLVAAAAVVIYLLLPKTPQFGNAPSTTYLLPGQNKGQGMSFSVPSGLTVVQDSSQSLKEFNQKNSSSDKTSIRSIVALSWPQSGTIGDASAKSVARFKDLITNTTSAIYYNKDYPNLQSLNLKLTYLTFTTDAAIKDKGGGPIKIDYVATTAGAKPAEVDGTMIYVLGKTTSYYFIVSSTHDLWQQDQKIWTPVLNSLKIDQ